MSVQFCNSNINSKKNKKKWLDIMNFENFLLDIIGTMGARHLASNIYVHAIP